MLLNSLRCARGCSPLRSAPELVVEIGEVEKLRARKKSLYFRRIATRYDKLAANFLSAIYLAAAVSYWVIKSGA